MIDITEEFVSPSWHGIYRKIDCMKFSASNGDLLEYNGSQGADRLD